MANLERAIETCRRAMESGCVSEGHVRVIMKAMKADVTCLEPFLVSKSADVRKMVAPLVGKHGNACLLVEAMMKETDIPTKREMLKALSTRGEVLEEGLEQMVFEDGPLREDLISMLCKAGKAESLMPLLFDKDEHLVQRVKRCLDGQNEKSSSI